MGKVHDRCDNPIEAALMLAARGWVTAQGVDAVQYELDHYSTAQNRFLYAAERAWTVAADELVKS